MVPIEVGYNTLCQLNGANWLRGWFMINVMGIGRRINTIKASIVVDVQKKKKHHHWANIKYTT
jgi:hypothetical protein